MFIEIKPNPVQQRELEQLFKDFPEQAPKIFVRALNETAKHGERIIARQITQELNVRNRDLRKGTKHFRGIRTRRAHAGRGIFEAGVSITGAPIPVIFYNPRQTRQGVSFKALKRRPRKTIRHAFIAEMSTGHVGVFKRRGRKRLPLTSELRFGSITNVVDVRAESFFRNVLAKRFDDEFTDALRVYLKGFK